jgi:hypothetical protein
MEEAADKKADKDYDQDGEIESGKDEYLGSKIRAAKKAGKLKEGTCTVCKKEPCVCKKEKKCNECGMFESKCECSVMENSRPATNSNRDKFIKAVGKKGMLDHPDKRTDAEKAAAEKSQWEAGVGGPYKYFKPPVKKVDEAKPSAGLSKAKKSATVKAAKKGEDIGKPGKGFKALAKKAGGGEKGEKIAAAAMWKNIKETTAYLAEKKKKEKMTDENLVPVPNPSGAKDAEEAKKLGAMMPKPAGSSKDPISESGRLRELTGRLNRAEKPMVAESREVDQIRELTRKLLG